MTTQGEHRTRRSTQGRLRNVGSVMASWPFTTLFSIALIAAFSPSKALGAASGGLVVLAALLALAAVHRILDPTTHALGVLLHLVTHAHFALAAIIPDAPPSRQDIKQLVRFATGMLLIQAPLGMLQAVVARSRSGTFDSANGDSVNGTIDVLVAFGSSAPHGSNVMFAIALLSLIIIVLGFGETRTQRTVAALSLMTFILASVVHLQLFLFLASIGLLGCIGLLSVARAIRGRPFNMVGGTAVPLLLASTFAIAAILLPQNYGTFRNYVLPEVDNLTAPAPAPAPAPGGESPSDRFGNHKLKVALITLWDLPTSHRYQPVIGVGAGQFNSRAGLIASGTYLEGLTIPEGMRGVSSASETHFMPLWLGGRPRWVGSAWFPFFSVQSLYAELGLLGLAGVGLAAFAVGRRVIRALPSAPLSASSVGVLLLFIFGIGMFENYWEWTQAIIVPFTFLWVMVGSPKALTDSRIVSA